MSKYPPYKETIAGPWTFVGLPLADDVASTRAIQDCPCLINPIHTHLASFKFDIISISRSDKMATKCHQRPPSATEMPAGAKYLHNL